LRVVDCAGNAEGEKESTNHSTMYDMKVFAAVIVRNMEMTRGLIGREEEKGVAFEPKQVTTT
jgi:hypothetical protein